MLTRFLSVVGCAALSLLMSLPSATAVHAVQAPVETPAAAETAYELPPLREVPQRHAVAEVTVAAEPEPPAAAEPAPAAVAAPAPQPVKLAAPVLTCAANQFCYPRLGIAGAIVPYTDCSGSTDVGSAIRSISCVSPMYLAAHAWTSFGRIHGWRVGDIVFAYGSRYVVYDAFTQPGCEPPARAIAPLSLQTSLTPATCGPILVVQARPD